MFKPWKTQQKHINTHTYTHISLTTPTLKVYHMEGNQFPALRNNLRLSFGSEAQMTFTLRNFYEKCMDGVLSAPPRPRWATLKAWERTRTASRLWWAHLLCLSPRYELTNKMLLCINDIGKCAENTVTHHWANVYWALTVMDQWNYFTH